MGWESESVLVWKRLIWGESWAWCIDFSERMRHIWEYWINWINLGKLKMVKSILFSLKFSFSRRGLLHVLHDCNELLKKRPPQIQSNCSLKLAMNLNINRKIWKQNLMEYFLSYSLRILHMQIICVYYFNFMETSC
jgi:hypothetical protein